MSDDVYSKWREAYDVKHMPDLFNFIIFISKHNSSIAEMYDDVSKI